MGRTESKEALLFFFAGRRTWVGGSAIQYATPAGGMGTFFLPKILSVEGEPEGEGIGR